MSVTHDRSADASFTPTGALAWDAAHTLDIDASDRTASYSISAGDNQMLITFSSGSAMTVTVPASLGAGFSCLLARLSTGAVSVGAGAGVTLNSRGALFALNGQWAIASLVNRGGENYILGGDLV